MSTPLSPPIRSLEALSVRRRRIRAYFAVLAAFYVLALAAVSLKDEFDFAVSDGRYYYAYLSSAVVDGDLDFSNQIREHWGPDFDPSLLEEKTSRGYVHNKYPIGMAVTLAPSFLVAHAVSHVVHAVIRSERFAPDGYSVLYQLSNLAFVLILGLLGFLWMDEILVELLGVRPWWAFLAIVLYWTGSHYAYYYFREPLMVHVVSTFWVTAAIRLSMSKQATRWLAFSVAMAVVCRPTNALLMLPFMVPLARRRPTARALPFVLVGAIPILLQLMVWKILHGSFVHYSYEEEGFRWLSPALVSTLVSSKHGLLFWSPILAFSLLGIGIGLRSSRGSIRRTTAMQLVLSLGLLWYVNSSWHQWWFGDAFGARAFLEGSFAFVVGLAWFLEASARGGVTARRITYGLLALSFVYSYALMALYVTNRIPRADYLF